MTEGKTLRDYKRPARRRSRPIWLGTTRIGGDGVVAIEARIPDRAPPSGGSESDDRFEIRLARKLESAGADLICRSCTTPDAVRALAELAPTVSVPLVADIGACDPVLAAAAAEAGARAIWFRPPAAGDDVRLPDLVAVGREYGCALGLVIDDQATLDDVASIAFEQALARYAVVQAGRMKALGNPDFIVALRIREPALMAATARAISHVGDFPLALSIGASQSGNRAPEASSAMAMGLPLLMGIGDLVCLSAGSDPAVDVHVAVSALRSLGLRRRGVSVAADPAFLRMHPDAAKIATMLEERVNHIGQTIDVRLAGSAPGTETALTAQLADPPAGADAEYGMRIAGPVDRNRPVQEIVAELAELVEESAAGIDARDLEGLVADLSRRAGAFRGALPDAAMLWARLAVALRHVYRGRTARLVWGHPDGAAIHARLTGKREPWQIPQPVAGAPPAAPNDAAAAISIAMGLALADRAEGIDSDVVAIVDRATFDAGAAYEAMRAAGACDASILIVLIDPAGGDEGLTGTLGSQLSRVVSSRPYLTLRQIGSRIARQLPANGYTLFKRLEEFGRGLATGGTLFEELGLFYVGPVAGRGLGHLLPILRNLRRARTNSPALLHVVGGDVAPSRRPRPADTKAPPVEALSTWLDDAVRTDPKIQLVVAGTPDGIEPALSALAKTSPGRIHRVGSAAHHGVGLAWGFAAGGLHPFMLMDRRSFWRSAGEHAREIVRLRLPICFLVDLTHGHAPEPWLDAPPLNLEAVPGFLVATAADDRELARLLPFARSMTNQPVLIGYQGRGAAVSPEAGDAELQIGRGRIAAHGTDIAILAAGRGVAAASLAADALAEKGVSVTLADARFTQPLDAELVNSLFAAHRGLIVLDDPAMAAGIARGVVDILSKSSRQDFRHRLRVASAGRGSVREIVAAAADMPAGPPAGR